MDKSIEQLKEEFNLDSALTNLYHISLQYYTLLRAKDHPMKKLITDIMDKLIELKKSDDSPITKKAKYDEIHAEAYKNIETIYDYDKEQDEKNGISSEVGKLKIRIETESNDVKMIENNDVEVSGECSASCSCV